MLFRSSFFGWVFLGSVLSFFFLFFLLGLVSLGTGKKKKKLYRVIGMGPTISVKNIE